MKMASVVSEPPSVLARVDRLDVMLGYLEEMRSGRRSPAASTASSGTMTSGGGGGNSSSFSSSPVSLTQQGRRCRPIGDVVAEAREKGGLVDRIDRLEARILKLEEERVLAKREGDNIDQKSPRSVEKRRHGKGLKRLVKSCVHGDLKTKE